MVNAKIQLPNGTTVTVEGSVADLVSTLNGVGGAGNPKETKRTNYNSTGFKHAEERTIKYPRHVKRWSDRDIIEVARIVRANSEARGVTKLVRKYIKSKGDTRQRSEATIYTTTSDMKLYFKTGDRNKISTRTREILDKEGIYPLSGHSSRKEFLPSVKEVQEA